MLRNGEGGKYHFIDPKLLQPGANTDDLRHRIEALALGEGDGLRRLAMELPRCLGNTPEDGCGVGLHKVRKLAGGKLGFHFGQRGLLFVVVVMMVMPVLATAAARLGIVTMLVSRPGVDGEGDALRTRLALEVHVEISQLQLGKLPLEGGGGDAEVAKGAHEPVSTEAVGSVIDIKGAHKLGGL